MADKQPPQWFWKQGWDLYLLLVARQSKEQIFRGVKDPDKLSWSVLVNTYIPPFSKCLGNAQTIQLLRDRELELILSNPSVLSQFLISDQLAGSQSSRTQSGIKHEPETISTKEFGCDQLVLEVKRNVEVVELHQVDLVLLEISLSNAQIWL